MLFARMTFMVFLAVTILLPGVASAARTTIIRNVNIVPMDSERIITGRAVIVMDGRISAIVNEDSVTVPDGSTVIDGSGAYLIPGLADMHTHLASFDRDPGHLILYLTHGVTTARSMSGTPRNLSWREMVDNRKLDGPAIYTSGPVLSGLYGNKFGLEKPVKLFHAAVLSLPVIAGILALFIISMVKKAKNRGGSETPRRRFNPAAMIILSLMVLTSLGFIPLRTRIIPFMFAGRFIIQPDYYISETPAQAAKEVVRQKRTGYDCLKVYDFLTEDEYRAAVRKASELDFYVTGHLPDQVPLDVIVGSGQDELAHIDELQSYHWIGYRYGTGEEDPGAEKRFEFDYGSIPVTVALVKESGMGAVSTLAVKETMRRLIQDTDKTLSGPEYSLVRKETVEHWRTSGKCVTSLREYGNYREYKMQPFLAELTKELHRSGITMAIGTDTSVEGMVPGYHLHRELEILVEAGLTPFEALETGTRNAGVIISRMGLDGDFGTIEVGRRADLVLLEGNPLEDISNTRKIAGVMARGRWYPRGELEEMLSSFLSTY